MKIFLMVMLFLATKVTADQKEPLIENPEIINDQSDQSQDEKAQGFISTPITDGRIVVWYYQDRTEIIIIKGSEETHFSSDENVILYQADKDLALIALLPLKDVESRNKKLLLDTESACLVTSQQLEKILRDERNLFGFLEGNFRLKALDKTTPQKT